MGSWNHLPTTDSIEVYMRLRYRRFLIVEKISRPIVIIYVPRKEITRLYRDLKKKLPKGTIFYVKVLPLWRCRFTKQQRKKK